MACSFSLSFSSSLLPHPLFSPIKNYTSHRAQDSSFKLVHCEYAAPSTRTSSSSSSHPRSDHPPGVGRNDSTGPRRTSSTNGRPPGARRNDSNGPRRTSSTSSSPTRNSRPPGARRNDSTGPRRTTSSASSLSSQTRNGRPPGVGRNDSMELRRTTSSAPSSQPRQRHWKQGEYPGVSETSIPAVYTRPPIKNVKKKLDKKNQAKGWANTVTEALSDCIDKKQWLQALEVFEMLKEQPFYQPKEGTYMRLLLLLGRTGQPQRAQILFDEMVEAGIEPTAELYTALLTAYCRSDLIHEAFAVLNQMKTLPQSQPDVFTYSTLIKACIDNLQFELVQSLFEEMAARSIAPNTVTLNIVLSGYGKAGMYDKMEEVLSGMLEGESCKPDVWTMNVVLGVFGDKGQIETMERWYEKFRDFGIEPETRTLNILIGAYGKKRLYDKMSTVMEYMRKLQFPWTTATYNNVIEAFADVGDAKNMEYTFDQMRAEGMKADTKTFCCLINGYANAGLFHKVISSVQLAGKFEIPENITFYNAVISACAKADDLMEMERVFNRMKEKQCLPDSSTYAIMIEAYRKEGMNDKVYYLEQELSADGIQND